MGEIVKIFDDLTLEQKRATIDAADKEIERRRLANPLKYFTPNGWAEELIRAFGERKDKWIFVMPAANSLGKTAAAINILGNVIWGPQSQWFDFPRFKDWTFPKKCWYVSENSTLKDFVCGTEESQDSEIKKWFPKGKFTFFKSGLEFYSRLHTDNNWVVNFKTLDMDPSKFESDKIGLCIEENERILMADGRWIKMRDVQIGDAVVSLGSKFAHGRKENHGISCPKAQNNNWVSNKVVYENKELLRIVCRGGLSVKCTPDHRFFVQGRGWIRADEIKENEKIATPEFELKGRSKLEIWQARVMGLLIGDGYIAGRGVHWTCFDDILLEDVKTWLPKEIFLRAKERRQFYMSVGNTGGHHTNPIKNLLVAHGLWGKLAYDKFIPDTIFGSPREIQIEFLRYLYATDGWFSGRAIGYASTSEQLCSDLVLLLRNLGIRSGKYFKKSQKPGKWRDQWFVLISRRSDILRFSNNIVVPSKEEAQRKVCDKAKIVKRGKEAFADRETSRMIKKTRRYSFVKSIEKCGTGTVIDIQTEPNHNFIVNGFLAHNCIFDEPPGESIFNAVLARLTFGGVIVMPMTPLYSSAWVKDRLIDSATEKSPVHVAYGDIERNCKEHGVRGRLEHAQIEAIISQYDPDEVDARAHGQFMHLTGLVLKGIDPDKHRHQISPFDFHQDNFRIYTIMDPHDAWPPLIGWFGIDQWKRIWGIDEFPVEDYHTMHNFKKTTPDMARMIKEKEELYKWNPTKIKRVCDPNFGKKPIQAVGMTVRDYYAKCGRDIGYPLNFDCEVNDNLEIGHKLVRDWLAKNPDGETRLKIGALQNNIWRDMNRFSFRPQSDKKEETDGQTDLVAKKYKAGVDLLRYLTMFMRPPDEAQKEIDPKDLPWWTHLAQNVLGQNDDGPADWRNPFRV